jgi:hypothetical protein
MAATRTEVLREGIRALAAADISALQRLTEEVREATGPRSEGDRAEGERLRQTLDTLLTLTERNVRLLRGMCGRLTTTPGSAAERRRA